MSSFADLCFSVSRYIIVIMAVAIIASLVQSTAASAVTPALAHTSPSQKDADKAWAQFCDDTNCLDNCGEWVDVSNSGCLSESGRKSFNIKTNGPVVGVGLVYSPGSTCNCQTECEGINWSSGCSMINATLAPSTNSYRFSKELFHTPRSSILLYHKRS